MKLNIVYRSIALAGLAVLIVGCPLSGKTVLPTVVFTASQRLGEAPFEVAYDDQSEGNDSAITGWLWDFGDGATGDTADPVHTYANPGLYTVTLTITTADGDTAFLRKRNNITVLDPIREEGTVAGEERLFAGMAFVWIPAGTFTMGDQSAIFPQDDASPPHDVTITRGFWLGKYEVSQSEWENVLGERPSFFEDLNPLDREFFPVEQVSWADAQRFISALNQTGQGLFRLPTEAEWEYACRAGTQTTFSFGDDPLLVFTHAWCWLNSPFRHQPLGVMLPNAWGLHDMHGNVSEWVQDYFYDATYYATSPAADPLGPEYGPFRIARGGSYRDPEHSITSATREPYVSGAYYSFIGLRIVKQ